MAWESSNYKTEKLSPFLWDREFISAEAVYLE